MQIRSDIRALASADVKDSDLREILAPVSLIVGERSLQYRKTMERLAAVLPSATVSIIGAAGHMMHAEAARSFNRGLQAWALAPAPD